MKKIFAICLYLISIHSYSQHTWLTKSNEKPTSKRIMMQANEKLKTYNIDSQKANIDDWEKVLKEIGEVTKTENTIFCKVSNTSNATLTFDKNQLIGVCEMYDDGKSKKKSKK